MFRVEHNVPDVYINESRDFQLFSRLYDLVFQSSRFSIDSLELVSDSMRCNDSLLPLIATKVGFFTELNLTSKADRQILSAFPYIIRHKGSMTGINLVTNLFERIMNTSVTAEQDEEDRSRVHIIFEDYTPNINLLYSLLEYIRPTGVFIDYIVRAEAKFSPEFVTDADFNIIGPMPETSVDQNVGESGIVVPVSPTNESFGDFASNVGFAQIADNNYIVANYLTFSSPNTFTLGVAGNTKCWDGTLEYSTDRTTWNEWDGTSAISSSADGNLYVRGTGNTKITGLIRTPGTAEWVLTGSVISCSGNIETLLDYLTVANGEHPAMAEACYANMFLDCTGLTTAPVLPATTLAEYCYYGMFEGCTGLTTAPVLPATTLAEYCYYGMFRKCTSLKFSRTRTGEYQTLYRIPASETGITAISALVDMFYRTGGTFTDTPEINTTYYTSNTLV